MTQCLVFSNTGTLDTRLLTTFGANVKLNESPIGFFGTGAKYALAVIYRLGGSVVIHTGESTLLFEKELETIRGKAFDTLWMWENSPDPLRKLHQRLPFTLELGKTWEPWMAYRELYSNCLDEGGTVNLRPQHSKSPGHDPTTTEIWVDCPALISIHNEHSKFFLDFAARRPFHSAEGVDFYYGPSEGIFYKGILVHKLERPAIYTYNLTSKIDLTEDRTLANEYIAYHRIARAAAELRAETHIESILCAHETKFESKFDFSNVYAPQEEFLSIAARMVASRTQEMNKSAKRLVAQHTTNSTIMPPCRPLHEWEGLQLQRALGFLDNLGWQIGEDILISHVLQEGVLGCIHSGKIILSEETFRRGTKCVAGTILEEHLHITKGLEDESRAMQNFLLDSIMTLGERLQGEPL